MDNETLLQYAKEAQKKAYAPYSRFAVGACLMAEDGTLFTGCNVENASYGATNCAERTAIFKAVSEGYQNFTKIAVAGGEGKEYTFPCGICLQVLLEFMPEGSVVLECSGKIREFKLSELLPFGFQL